MMIRKAFTLVELMLTVMVIAVLVSIAIPNYINTVERARAREARSTLESMRAAQQSYAAERRVFIALPNAAGNDAPWEAVGLENPNNNANRSWNYDVTLNGAGFDATAVRTSGPYQGDSITLDQDGGETVSGFY